MYFKDIIVHEKYSNEAYGVEYNDLAILKLETPLVFDHHVQPACLPDPSTSSENIEDMAVVSGWGKTRESKLSSHLYNQKFDFKIQSNLAIMNFLVALKLFLNAKCS